MEKYNASSIKSLTQHQHLLKRLSLTFGSESGDKSNPFSSQKNVAIREVIDNALDELRAGYGNVMKVSFFKDGSVEVKDSGRGIPVDIGLTSNGEKASGIYLALGLIQSGGKFNTESKRYSAGLNGVGSSSTNHCSKRFDVSVYRNNKCYQLSFQDGEPGFFDGDSVDSNFIKVKTLSDLKISKDKRSSEEKELYPTGTVVRFWLRDEVFQSKYPFDKQDIIERLKGTAFLCPNITIDIFNEFDEENLYQTFHYVGGIKDLIEINVKKPISEPLYLNLDSSFIEKNVPVLQKDGSVKGQDVKRNFNVELALQWEEGYESNIESYVNTIRTKLGGVHETALQKSLVNAFNSRITSMRGLLTKSDPDPIAQDYVEGLTGVIHVQVSEPQFTSQSKEQLSGTELRSSLINTLTECFSSWMNKSENKQNFEIICQKVAANTKNRSRIQTQKELNRKKNEIKSSSLPSKLIDCENAGGSDSELYICEGDSALGCMKAARDSKTQALIPIGGKIINALKNSPSKILENKEAKDIIATLGAGFGSDFDINKMRYERVFLAADADPDGYNICTLLFALFWEFFRPVIEQGKFYKINPPLFVVSTKEGKKSRKIYCNNELERDKQVSILQEQNIKYDIARLKGLGEMRAEDLSESCLDKETRSITKISLPSVQETLEALELIFGDDTDLRKEWIKELELDEGLLQ